MFQANTPYLYDLFGPQSILIYFFKSKPSKRVIIFYSGEYNLLKCLFFCFNLALSSLTFSYMFVLLSGQSFVSYACHLPPSTPHASPFPKLMTFGFALWPT